MSTDQLHRDRGAAGLASVLASTEPGAPVSHDRWGQPLVLLVDDDERMLRALSVALRQRGFATETASDAGEALKVLDIRRPHAIILDVMMPILDGRQFCRIVRDRFDAPILMLTALEQVDERVAGLEAGADDYMTKPFAIEELVARLRALLRRTQRTGSQDQTCTYADLFLDTTRWEVHRAGIPLKLTSKEFRILELFMRSPGRVFSRQEILDTVWGEDDFVESNVVDVHVALLRHKMEAGGLPRLVQTIRGVGYSLRE